MGARANSTTEEYSLESDEVATSDYYTMLGIEEKACASEIKAAYHRAAKVCHPDVAGVVGQEMFMLVNKAYSVLADTHLRAAYDSGRLLFGSHSVFKDFTGRPLSKNSRPDAPHVLFVDETACIGCKACVHEAPNTFLIEDAYGRARVDTQWADAWESLDIAVNVCPVECIHVVPTEDLAILEWVHRSQPRTAYVQNTTGSKGGAARGVEESPFVASERFRRKWEEVADDLKKERQNTEKEAQVAHAVRRATGGWWPFRKRTEDASTTEVKSNIVQSCPLIKTRDATEAPLQLPVPL